MNNTKSVSIARKPPKLVRIEQVFSINTYVSNAVKCQKLVKYSYQKLLMKNNGAKDLILKGKYQSQLMHREFSGLQSSSGLFHLC